jgi:sporulation protein YlmC with PRC-barrel domain
MITKVEKQNVISFRYGKNEETDYILTLDGKEIGRVYELELAQMIEDKTNAIEGLQFQIEEQKKDLQELQFKFQEVNLKLKKIHKLTLTT